MRTGTTLELVAAVAATALGLAVLTMAWRIRSPLTGALALLGSLGAAASFALAAVSARDVAELLVLSAAVIAMAGALLAIGRLFNRLLGPEPD